MPASIPKGQVLKVPGSVHLLVLLWVATCCIDVPAAFSSEPPSETNQQNDPCSGRLVNRPSEGFEKFGLPEPTGDPWREYNQVMLSGQFRDLIECSDQVELLVPFDRDNPGHIRKRKTGNTVRENLIMFGEQAEYFKYILPTTQLKDAQIEEARTLLLGPAAYLEFGSGPQFSGIIHGSRYVFRFTCGELQAIVTISKVNLPSIWFSGAGLQPFGGLLHPDVELRWHEIAKAATKS